jgi:hypothetical protein
MVEILFAITTLQPSATALTPSAKKLTAKIGAFV